MNQKRSLVDLASQPQYEPDTGTTDSSDCGYVDLMHGPGELVYDEMLDPDAPSPSRNVAGLFDRTNPGRLYLFSYNKYAIVDVEPNTNIDTIVWGPKLIFGNWRSFEQLGFVALDAVLPSPRNKNEAYFFCYNQVALIHFQPDLLGNNNDYVVRGPTLISKIWPVSLPDFDTVDAILPNPMNAHEAYFFSDNMYVLMKFHQGSANTIIHGPTPITEGWPSIKEAGFDRLDTVLPNPSVKHEAYFFREKECVLVNVKENGKDDFIVSGPHAIADVWPSLVPARFYMRPKRPVESEQEIM